MCTCGECLLANIKTLGSSENPAQDSGLHLQHSVISMNALLLWPLVLSLSCCRVRSQCSVTRYVSYVEREECSHCLLINTTICAGFCMSRDVHIKALLPKVALIQKVCTYQEIKYIAIKLPGCPPNVDPFYRFPVILSCACSQCATDTTDCTNGIDAPFYCTKPQWSIPTSRSRTLSLAGNV